MVLIHSKKLAKKVPIRGKQGAGIVDKATMALIETGLPWDKIFASIGAATYASLAGLATKKLVDKITEKKEAPPPLIDAPIKQGTLKGDLVRPNEAGVTRIDPKNHEIDLPGPYVLTSQGVQKQAHISKGMGIPKNTKTNTIRRKKVDQLLDSKSKDILSSLKMGKGIFNI